MQKIVLDNGLTAVSDLRSSDTVAVEVSVRAGSINEPEQLAGVSHFLEHMLFEGTKKRRDSRLIANEIERVGGELNAATSNNRTLFYAKVPRKHFNVAVDVLADILQNSVFPVRGFENNRKVILDEINLVNDEPLFYQWVMFYRELFKGTPVGRPVYGSRESIKAMHKKELVGYYLRNYTPCNMVVAVVGGATKKDILALESRFNLIQGGPKDNSLDVPQAIRSGRVTERRNINQSYMVLGYQTVPRLHGDSHVLDVIHAVLGRGQSGWMFDEIRNKKALGYNVGVEHHPELDYGLLAVNVGTRKENAGKVVKIILEQFKKLGKLTPSQLREAKTYIEGSRILQWEENLNRADLMCFYEHAGDFKAAEKYLQKINSVRLRDVKRVAKEYFTDEYTLTMLEQEI